MHGEAWVPAGVEPRGQDEAEAEVVKAEAGAAVVAVGKVTANRSWAQWREG